MIAFVHGMAVDMTESSVVVEAGGIGFVFFLFFFVLFVFCLFVVV